EDPRRSVRRIVIAKLATLAVAQNGDCVARNSIVEPIALAEAAAMFTELPRKEAASYFWAIYYVGEGHRFFRRESLAKWLDEDFDLATAGQPHIERHLVADAVGHQARVVLLDDLLCVFDHVVFDATARYRSDELAIFGDRHLGARPARR